MCISYMKILWPYYTRDLSILGFWCLWRVLVSILWDTEGQPYSTMVYLVQHVNLHNSVLLTPDLWKLIIPLDIILLFLFPFMEKILSRVIVYAGFHFFNFLLYHQHPVISQVRLTSMSSLLQMLASIFRLLTLESFGPKDLCCPVDQNK